MWLNSFAIHIKSFDKLWKIFVYPIIKLAYPIVFVYNSHRSLFLYDKNIIMISFCGKREINISSWLRFKRARIESKWKRGNQVRFVDVKRALKSFSSFNSIGHWEFFFLKIGFRWPAKRENHNPNRKAHREHHRRSTLVFFDAFIIAITLKILIFLHIIWSLIHWWRLYWFYVSSIWILYPAQSNINYKVFILLTTFCLLMAVPMANSAFVANK